MMRPHMGPQGIELAFTLFSLFGPRREKPCLREYSSNKDADKPAHPHSLISAFVIRFLESTISKLASSEISIFQLVPVAEQAGLNLTLSEIPKTGFVASRPIYCLKNKHYRLFTFILTILKTFAIVRHFYLPIHPLFF